MNMILNRQDAKVARKSGSWGFPALAFLAVNFILIEILSYQLFAIGYQLTDY